MESSQNYELSQVPLDDLLLALEVTKSSVDLSLKSKVGDARLSVHQGRLDDASFGDQSGPEAVLSMLSLEDGRYEVCAKSSHPKGLNKSLAQIVQQKLRSSGPPELSRASLQPPVSSPLERTGTPLPHGLEAAELRTLALVNGELTALDIAAREETSPADTLRAVRQLVQRGLIRASKRGTLALGTRIPLTVRDTLQSVGGRSPGGTLAGPQALAERSVDAPSPGAQTEQRPKSVAQSFDAMSSDDGSEPPVPSSQTSSGDMQPVPARLRGSLSRKPRDTGYSSVPPPSLAEEVVNIPSSLRSPNSDPKPEPEASPRAEKTEAEPSLSLDPVPSRPSPSPSRQIHSALNAATVLPDTGGAVSRSYGSDDVRHEDVTAQVPSVNKASEQSREESIGSARPKMDSDEIGPDPVVVDAAQGQLRDSEMPLPSSRLGQRALEQLDELNEAVASSRKPKLPSFRASKDATGDLNTAELAAPGSVPHPDLLPGETTTSDSNLPKVGRYEILARLKRGGMGSVYMCRLSGSAGFRRHFAMKVLHGHLAQQDDALEAFFHEARVLGGLHHRNIVGIADVGTPNEPYFVLEYVEGGSMAELHRATTNGRDPGLVVSVILDALSGLAAAHEAVDDEGSPLQLVHCDVTPHNLLVGIDGTCRVTDFGIARTNALGPTGDITRGKPGYVAPERLERKPSDHRSDLFSLGVVLYAGLTGVEPFAGATADDTMRNVLQKSIVPPSEVGFRPPPSLDWVCMKALARDPRERFQSAEEMANQLRRIAAREGLLSSPTEVANWVRESLAPTLAARRAASMRGTGTAESRYQPSSIPPAVDDVGEAPAPSPSAAENTGPVEPPASSHGFRDKTETLSLQENSDEQTDGKSRAKTMAVYGVLALAVGVLVWVALSPNSVAGFLRMTPPAGQASGLDKGVRPADAEAPSLPPTAPEEKSPAAGEDQDTIVIPAIPPERDR